MREGAHLRRALPLAAGLTVLGILLAALATAEVLARGELLHYTPMTVERVRVLGGVELWVARESLARLDALNGLILGLGAAVALVTATRTQREVRVCFLVLGAGLGFLALDEMLALHETVGYNLEFLASLPGTNSPEDVVFALYVIPALAFFAVFRDVLRASPWGARLVVLGVVLFGVAAALDVTDALLDEQWVEPPASAVLVAGFALVAGRHLASLPPDAVDTGRDRSPAARA
ncbi:MAG: hypothetical protein JW895_11530 [Thermoleophilaceae bacterium]|nr:hypothetical protein [Thermoleophilaceae bacterium]